MDAVCSKPALFQHLRHHGSHKEMAAGCHPAAHGDWQWVGRECCQCTDAGTVLPTAETVTFRKPARPSLGKSTIKYASQKDIKKAVSGLRRVYAAITLDEAKK